MINTNHDHAPYNVDEEEDEVSKHDFHYSELTTKACDNTKN
jgi:hypothetical protein